MAEWIQRFYDKLADNTYRRSFSLTTSVVAHTVILLLMVLEFSWGSREFEKTPPALLMVDLTKVEIGDKTNLPPEVKKTEPKKEQPAPPPVKKPETKTPKVEAAPPAPKEPAKPKPAPKQENAAKVQPPKPKEQPKKKVEKTPAPKKPAPAPAPQKTTKPAAQPNAGLQSLLASVDKVRKPLTTPSVTSVSADSGAQVNQGIKGGTGGTTLSALTISERDYIVNSLRKVWSVDGGVEGIEKMIVEIRIRLTRGGDVQETEFLNMKNNPTFKSVAESARRAIYICNEMGEASPFRRLARERAATYSDWKSIVIQFNPTSGEVY